MCHCSIDRDRDRDSDSWHHAIFCFTRFKNLHAPARQRTHVGYIASAVDAFADNPRDVTLPALWTCVQGLPHKVILTGFSHDVRVTVYSAWVTNSSRDVTLKVEDSAVSGLF